MQDQTDTLTLSCLHDLRNPLATIYASAQMLTEFDASSPQIKRLGINIYRAACRMREMLADLTTEARGQGAEASSGDLRDIIVRASEAALAGIDTRTIQMIVDVPAPIEMPLIRSRVERVFFNLFTNSIQAMARGGTIRVSAVIIDDWVRVEVEDTGPGIPGPIRDRLFERFVTADKENGLGLGLAVSRQTIVDHGGDMWIEPAPGARFVICLPRFSATGIHQDTLRSD
jgi:signal transduction histidine kinase